MQFLCENRREIIRENMRKHVLRDYEIKRVLRELNNFFSISNRKGNGERENTRTVNQGRRVKGVHGIRAIRTASKVQKRILLYFETFTSFRKISNIADQIVNGRKIKI